MKRKLETGKPPAVAPKTKGRSDDFDVHIGARLKLFRTARGLSQSDLASQTNVTFQQLQKYEKRNEQNIRH